METDMATVSRHVESVRSVPVWTPITVLGWIATVTAVLMYVSYISQIQLNLSGQKGSVIQPFATVMNCSLWTAYGLLKPIRDWPLSLANAPGVLLGAMTFATAL